MAPLPDRDELLRQWHEHADAVFRRLFPEDSPPTVPAFDRLETQTVQLAQDLAAWLLEQRTQHAEPVAQAQPCCPRCAQVADPAPDDAHRRPRRAVVTRAGPVEFRRERYRCTTCRVVFFPPR